MKALKSRLREGFEKVEKEKWESVGGKIQCWLEYDPLDEETHLYYKRAGRSNPAYGIALEDAAAISHAFAYFKNKGDLDFEGPGL